MASETAPPAIIQVNRDGIPAQMRKLKRWGLWEATWIPARQKYDKRPVHPNGHGLSSNRPNEWCTFEEVWAVYSKDPTAYGGVGFVITPQDNITCTDLDKCVRDGQPDAKSKDIIDTLATWTEYSPSGQGVHSWNFGRASRDCNTGIEVYSGHGGRYVTVTGVRPPGIDHDMREVPGSMLDAIISTYGSKRTTSQDGTDRDVPAILDELALPDIESLNLPEPVTDFLVHGADNGDRSNALFTAAVCLAQQGLNKQEIFSILANNPAAMAAAMSKRNYDYDRALEFLWVEDAQKGYARAAASRTTVDDFEVVGPGAAEVARQHIKKLAGKFRFLTALDAINTPPLTWLIKGVIPLAELGSLYGPSRAGKSFMAIDLAMAIARGESWRGHKVRQGAVGYVVAEGSRGFGKRLQAYAEFHDVDLSTVPLYPLYAAPNIGDDDEVSALIAAIKALLEPLAILFLDTKAQVTPGVDENSSEMAGPIRNSQRIARETGAMVVWVDHTGKDESRGSRGWSGVPAAMDVTLYVTRNGEDRAMVIEKTKDGDGEGKEYNFKLEKIVLGHDEDGDEISSCVAVERSGASAVRQPQLKGANQLLVMRLAAEATDLAGEVPVQTLLDAALAQTTAPEPGKRDQRKTHLRNALDELVAKGRLVLKDGNVSIP